ncbi:putative flavin-containing monoamine oxidase A [Aplochiton taeniatus]
MGCVMGNSLFDTRRHVMELIQELGVEVYPQYTTGKKVHHVGGPHARIRTYRSSIPALSLPVLLDLSQLLWRVDRLVAKVSVEDPSKTPNATELDSMTLQSYLDRHTWTQELKEEIALSSRAVFGMEPSQMSFLYFLVYAAAAGGLLRLLESNPGSAQEYRVKGGTQQLSEGLADLVGRQSVQLGSAVAAIWQDDEGATVKTATRSFRCRAVVVTCPPHQAAKIHYQPALPFQREFLTQNMPTGHLIKFIITYQTCFWREKGFSGEIVVQPSEDCPICVTFDATSPSGSPALVGFIAAQQATQWSSKEVKERRGAVVGSLEKYLGPEASTYIHYEERDWAKEEYSGGCPVNVMAPGLLTYYHPALRKPFARIHWAGTETSTQWCGFMSGAVESGQRAALEVLDELCSSTLTQEEKVRVQQERIALSRPWQLPEPRPSYHLGRALLVGLLTMGAALLLAKPKLCRSWNMFECALSLT